MTSRKSYFVCATAVALSFGCGAAEDLGENIDSTTEASVTFAPALNFGEDDHGYWYPAGLSPKYMQPMDTYICFLTSISGAFLSPNDGVWITGLPGINVWALNGSSGTGSPQARSYCVRATPASQANPHEAGKYDPSLYQWPEGPMDENGEIDMGPTAGRTCFITRVQGRMDAADNRVRTHKVGTRWKLSGRNTGASDDVRGSARCINKAQTADNYDWNGDSVLEIPKFGGVWAVFTDSTYGPACFLTEARGTFTTPSANVKAWRHSDSSGFHGWKLRGEPGGGRYATARCLF